MFVNFVDHGSPWMVSFPSGIVSNIVRGYFSLTLGKINADNSHCVHTYFKKSHKVLSFYLLYPIIYHIPFKKLDIINTC